jgi:hypothetical protein
MSANFATVYWLWLSNDIGVMEFDAGSLERAFAAKSSFLTPAISARCRWTRPHQGETRYRNV